MASPPVDSVRLRLLVALAVFKTKPCNQTCFAYIQSLRSSFPANESAREEMEGLWKERALKIEKECEALKQKLETTQLQSFLHNSQASKETQPSADATQKTEALANPSTSKKKAKQRQGDNSSKDEPSSNSFDVKPLLKKLEIGQTGQKAIRGPSLFETLDAFFSLYTLHGRADFPELAFVSITCRAINSLSISLDHAIKKAIDLDRLQTLDTLLHLIIKKSFPVIAICFRRPRISLDSDPWAPVLNQLSTTILVPLVRSFFLLSRRNLECLLPDDTAGSTSRSSNDRKGTRNVDSRPALLSLFRSVTTLVQSTLMSLARWTSQGSKKGARTFFKNSLAELSLFQHSLILECIRHLNQILMDETTKSIGSAKGRRLLRLVIKDTLWYLCSAMHIVITLNVESHTSCPPDVTADEKGPRPCDNNLYAHMDRLRVLKKTVLDCFLGLLVHLERARRSDTTLDMPFMAEHAPSDREYINKDISGLQYPQTRVGFGMDDRERDGEGSGGVEVAPVRMVGMGRVADADTSSGSIQAGESGTLDLSREHGFDGGGGGVHSLVESAETDRMHVVLDDMEHGMLLRVVEGYFNIS